MAPTRLEKWQKRMSVLKFEYPQTDEFKGTYTHLGLWCVLIVWFGFVLYFSIVGQLYETDSIYSTDFAGTPKLWYQWVFPPLHPPKECLGSIIQVQQCIDSLVIWLT
jgi:hypothetical protein